MDIQQEFDGQLIQRSQMMMEKPLEVSELIHDSSELQQPKTACSHERPHLSLLQRERPRQRAKRSCKASPTRRPLELDRPCTAEKLLYASVALAMNSWPPNLSLAARGGPPPRRRAAKDSDSHSLTVKPESGMAEGAVHQRPSTATATLAIQGPELDVQPRPASAPDGAQGQREHFVFPLRPAQAQVLNSAPIASTE